MTSKEKLTEEEIDYLTEMMNIGAGNAAGAMSQLLSCEVDVKLPHVYIMPPARAHMVFKNPDAAVLCVTMRMVGDVRGELFYVVPDEEKKNMLRLVKRANPGAFKAIRSPDSSVFEEIANITVGVFLTAIHDFTKLNIYHTVPNLVIDTVENIMIEIVSLLSEGVEEVILLENEFILAEGNVRATMVMVPVFQSMDMLKNSIDGARKGMGQK